MYKWGGWIIRVIDNHNVGNVDRSRMTSRFSLRIYISKAQAVTDVHRDEFCWFLENEKEIEELEENNKYNKK